ncbi:FkbM family methyltransferase [Sodalis sp. RH16]|uniref:FkbM family methyltransferase n=1 Tax=Sodalis sp. RH16 TaxID=3394331 RepID=UPI0039B48C84
MTFVSFAQNYEDVILWRALNRFGPGFYIDVGASDPVNDSVTKAFYDHGWHGINIEPMKESYDNICKDRLRDINLNIAIDKQNGTKTFYSIDSGNGLSTSVKDYADKYTTDGKCVNELEVETKTLAYIFKNFVTGDVHFLKIDVEGSEEFVLEGADFTTYRPWIVLVEATKPNTSDLSYHNWEHLLIDVKYTFVYFDGLNRFYVANEKVELLQQYFSAPPNYFDFFVLYRNNLNLEKLYMFTQEFHAISELVLNRRDESARAGNESSNIELNADSFADIKKNINLLLIENERLRKLNDDLCKNIDILEQQKTEILQSYSWSMTKPVRAIVEKINKLIS